MTERADRRPAMGQPEYFPDHEAEHRRVYRSSTPATRVAEAIRLSRFATRVALAARARR